MNAFVQTAGIAAGIFASSVLCAVAQSILAPDAKLEKLSEEFSFTEGPTCDRAGNLFFTDQNNNRIMEWNVDGKLSTFLQPSGRANGMYMDAKGNLIVCADEKTELWSIAPDKKVTILVNNFDGKYLNGPNDVWITPKGDLYITDPFYKRPWWDHDKMAQDGEHVYHVSSDGKTVTRVTTDLKKPNGITGTPNGKTLYVADIEADRTYRYDIQKDGTLKNKTLFCPKGSDGMTIDKKGNIYITGNGVYVYDKKGALIDHIDVPEPWTANVSFGGPDHKTLFITASKCLYSIRCKYKGANQGK